MESTIYDWSNGTLSGWTVISGSVNIVNSSSFGENKNVLEFNGKGAVVFPNDAKTGFYEVTCIYISSWPTMEIGFLSDGVFTGGDWNINNALYVWQDLYAERIGLGCNVDGVISPLCNQYGGYSVSGLFRLGIERLSDGTTTAFLNGNPIASLTFSDSQLSNGLNIFIANSGSGIIQISQAVYTPISTDISPIGISSSESFGVPYVTGPDILQHILLTGISSSESFGTPYLRYRQILLPTEISSSESFGTPMLGWPQSLSPSGISSDEIFGTLMVGWLHPIYPLGIASEQEFGLPTVESQIVPPIASFEYRINYLEVRFFDSSSNIPTNWLWDFGDDSYSSEENPTHIYPSSGSYTPTLTVTNAAGESSTYQDFTLDILPEEYLIAYEGSTATKGVYDGTQWVVGDLAVGETQTLTINAQVMATGRGYNLAIAQANEPQINITDSVAIVDLDIWKYVSPA
jgi:hypothetical protein